MKMTFDEETHKYAIDGVEYPSVTEICEPVSFKKLDAISKQVVAHSAERGRMIHELISDFVLVDDYEFRELPTELIPYIKAFVEWWRTYRPTTLYSEYMVGDIELGYCGTCDYIARIDGKVVLIDFKTTSTIDKKYLSVQLAGYKRLLKSVCTDVEQTYVLHLKKDGTYTYKEIEPDYEWFDILLKHNKKMRSGNGQRTK